MLREKTERVWVGVGSNQVNRNENIVLALLMLERDPKVRLGVCSRAYLSEPVSEIPQPSFVNAVVELETSYGPRELLSRLQEIEAILGRASGERWGPRCIDLDILLFGRRIVREPGLVVPHPRLQDRHFVLFPLAEVAPEVVHPILGMSVADMKLRLARIPFPPKPVEWGRVPRWSTVSTATSSSRA